MPGESSAVWRSRRAFFARGAAEFRNGDDLLRRDVRLPRRELRRGRALGRTSRRVRRARAGVIFMAQMLFIRREQGRVAELADAATVLAATVKGHPGALAIVSWILAEAGRTDEARRMLADAALRGFADFQRDWTWYCHELRRGGSDAPRGSRTRASLFELLIPFADRVAWPASSGAEDRSRARSEISRRSSDGSTKPRGISKARSR